VTAPLIFEAVALDDPHGGSVSLEVPGHQTLCIVGDGGSGVNRLAPIALGLESPSVGRALVYGEDISRMPRAAALAFRRRVGYVPAGDGLLQNLSLWDNVALPLRFGSTLSPREIHGRLRIMLAAVHLSERDWAMRPAMANPEQQRRASLARALAFDPDLVILDHPFDGIGNRTAAHLLEIARGGETAEGARRALFITGQSVPEAVRSRIEVSCRLAKGRLTVDS